MATVNSIGDTVLWSTSAEVIAGLVVAIVFVDVSATDSAREQVRWYDKLRVAALVAIAGGLACCLAALVDDRARTIGTAIVVMLSIATLGGLVGTRLTRLRDRAKRVADESAQTTGSVGGPPGG